MHRIARLVLRVAVYGCTSPVWDSKYLAAIRAPRATAASSMPFATAASWVLPRISAAAPNQWMLGKGRVANKGRDQP